MNKIDNKIELEKLGHQIRYFRLNLNLSQEQLANKCDFDRTYISMLERGKRNPSYLNLLKLVNGLNIKLYDLIKD